MYTVCKCICKSLLGAYPHYPVLHTKMQNTWTPIKFQQRYMIVYLACVRLWSFSCADSSTSGVKTADVVQTLHKIDQPFYYFSLNLIHYSRRCFWQSIFSVGVLFKENRCIIVRRSHHKYTKIAANSFCQVSQLHVVKQPTLRITWNFTKQDREKHNKIKFSLQNFDHFALVLWYLITQICMYLQLQLVRCVIKSCF